MNQSENSPKSANSEEFSEVFSIQGLLLEDIQRQMIENVSAHSTSKREQSRVIMVEEELKEEEVKEEEEEEVKEEQ